MGRRLVRSRGASRDFIIGAGRFRPGGTITFESFSSEVVHPTLSDYLSIWRNLWTDSMELATGARAYIREHYGA